MANDLIRMSGMNSGLDTESIINALTANTKLKATKQERNVLKYEATQEAYRDIISKMQNIKNKYFDVLNKDSYLSGTSMWNKYSSKVYDSANVETLASGISVTTTINSNAGDYKVAVNKTAKQAKLTGKSISGSAKVDLDSLTGDSSKEYGMTVTVGDTTKTISFNGAATSSGVRDNINKALEEAFGESNASVGDDADNAERYEGMVFLDDQGQITSRAGKGITMSGVGKMDSTNTIDLSSADLKTGTNIVSFQVGGKSVSTSFQTLEPSYFDKAISDGLINVADGTTRDGAELTSYLMSQDPTLSESDANTKGAQLMLEHSEAVSLYKQISEDYKESVRYDAFKSWKETASDDDINALYNSALAEQKDTQISKWAAADEELNAKYTEYKDSFARSALSSEAKSAYDSYAAEAGDDAKGIYEWAQDNDSYKSQIEDAEPAMKSAYEYLSGADLSTELSDKLTKLEHKYDGTGNGETDYDETYYEVGYDAYEHSYTASHLSDEARAAYDTYREGLDDPTTALSLHDWAVSDAEGLGNETAKAEFAEAQTDDPIKDFDSWKSEKIESDSWHLSKESWTASESNLFSQYKKSVYNESGASYDLSKENIIDHFNESALKNSIGNLELDDGTKFEVNYNADTNKAEIKAYTESTDGEGNTQKNYLQTAMTVGKNSANSAEALGNAGSGETTSITQITNSTKLSDIGATADENGNYNFTVNGKSFSFDGETTVNDMMKKVNASSAGVKMTYSSLDNAFTVTSSKFGLSSEVNIEDTDGGNLMGLLGITGGDFTAGENLEVYINGKLYQSETNSIDVDGSTFTISNRAEEPAPGEDPVEYTVSVGKDTSSIKDLIKDFVKDYNQLIEDVYKYLDEKPEKDYYFLTDSDKEDLDLTEKQEEKWEEKSKKGLLYHDSITTTVMTGLRTALMGSVEGLDGNVFSLSSMGLKTVSDYNQHGKFATVDDDALDKAIENHLDDIQKLFSDSDNGIMKKFSDALNLGIGSTGTDKGSLIRKAGLATGSSAKDNEIYNAIKRTKTQITALNLRYENEQNRLWKRYSSMESLLGTMNSQQASFQSYFM
ncbi:MAG: flagellar filament capping protein FliD [Ruminiclostridium sp.]|nr:flagellar filament capping protein FliD [Ruminiclostridium sp.]